MSLLSDCNAIEYTFLSKPAPMEKPESILPLGFKRTIRLCDIPLKRENWPPKTIFPSGCNRIQSTIESAPEPMRKLESKVPSGNNRTILFINTPL